MRLFFLTVTLFGIFSATAGFVVAPEYGLPRPSWVILLVAGGMVATAWGGIMSILSWDES